MPLLPAHVEQAAAHHLPPAGRPLHRHGLHRGLGLPRPPPAAHPPPLQHPQLAGARHHGHVPPTVRVRPLQLPAAHVLQLSHSLLQVDRYISTYLDIYHLYLPQVSHGAGPLDAGHHDLPHGRGHLYCRHHGDRAGQAQVSISLQTRSKGYLNICIFCHG